MKKNLFKIILPIFLIGVLCTTLYFTYGNKNQMERVKAALPTACDCTCINTDGQGGETSLGTVSDENYCSTHCGYLGGSKKSCTPVVFTPAVITCNNTTYTGGSHTIASCSGGTISNAEQTYAGSYTISCSGDSTHTDATSVTCYIYRAGVTFPTCDDVTYTGSEQTLFEAHTSGKYTNDALKGTNAGDYKVNLTPRSNYQWNSGDNRTSARELTCKVKAKEVSVTWSSNSPFTADGNQHSETPSVTLVTGETMTFKREYKNAAGTVLSEAPREAGTYTVTVSCDKVTGGQAKCDNYTLKEVTKTYAIEGTYDPGDGHVASVTLDKSTDEVEVGKTIILTATISPATATNKNVTWASDATGVATVNGGTVTGVSTGTAHITVTTEDGNKTATATITVVAASTPTVSVTGVSVDPVSGSVEVGKQLVLTANVTPTNASNKNVTWESSAPAIATVRNGVVTGVSAGTATITVTTEDGNKTATASITVTEPETPVTKRIQFERDTYTCEVGKTISVNVLTNTGAAPTVTSSDTSIATVGVFYSIAKCGVATLGANEKCITIVDDTFLGAYNYAIDCKAAGEVTLTATAATGITATATLTASEAGSKFSIVLDANGGLLTDSESEEYESLTVEGTGATTIATAISELGLTVTREGYTFLGWFADPEGGSALDETTEFGALGINKIYARWELIEGTEFTLTYDANGGTACSPATLTVSAGSAWGTLCTPTRKGYTFAGWFTAKNGGKKITSSTLAERSLTAYAQWIVNPKTGISTPVIALLVVALASIVAFLVIRKKKATSLE